VSPTTDARITAKSGRYGPYVTDGEKSASPVQVDGARHDHAGRCADAAHACRARSASTRARRSPRRTAATARTSSVVRTHARSSRRISCSRSRSTRPVRCFAQPKTRGTPGRPPRRPLREIGNDPVSGKPMVVRDGRFGPYVTDGETNASLRRGDSVEELTVERAAELLAERRARGPATKRAPAKRRARKAPAKRRPRRRPARRSGSRARSRLLELEAVAERIDRVKAPHVGQSRRRPARSRGRRRPAERQPVEIVDDERGMCLARRMKRRLDAEVQDGGTCSEPAAAASREGRPVSAPRPCRAGRRRTPVPAPRTQPGSRSAHGRNRGITAWTPTQKDAPVTARTCRVARPGMRLRAVGRRTPRTRARVAVVRQGGKNRAEGRAARPFQHGIRPGQYVHVCSFSHASAAKPASSSSVAYEVGRVDRIRPRSTSPTAGDHRARPRASGAARATAGRSCPAPARPATAPDGSAAGPRAQQLAVGRHPLECARC